MMRLHMFPIAPNPTKVRLYLAEKADRGTPLAVEEALVNLPEGAQRSEAFKALNPYGRVPVLEAGDGLVLIESLAIIDYLEEKFPDPSIWGDDPASRARAREIERIADLGVLIPLAREVHTTNSPLGLPPNPVVAAYHRDLAHSNLEYLEGLLADGRPFLCGDRPSVADCTLAAAFQFARFRELSPVDSFERISKWDAAYRARAAIAGVLVA